MLVQIIISLAIIVVTIIIHGLGTAWWLTFLLRKHKTKEQVFGFFMSLRILSSMAFFNGIAFSGNFSLGKCLNGYTCH